MPDGILKPMTVTVFPEAPTRDRLCATGREVVGATLGSALDALVAGGGMEGATSVIVLRHATPDQFFTAEQQERLTALMARWREARDSGGGLPDAEQAELEALVRHEQAAMLARTRALVAELPG